MMDTMLLHKNLTHNIFLFVMICWFFYKYRFCYLIRNVLCSSSEPNTVQSHNRWLINYCWFVIREGYYNLVFLYGEGLGDDYILESLQNKEKKQYQYAKYKTYSNRTSESSFHSTK